MDSSLPPHRPGPGHPPQRPPMDPRQRGPWPDDPRRRPPGEEGEMRGGGFPPPRGPPPNHWERGPPPGNNDRGGPPFRGPPGGPPGRGPPPGEFRGRGGLPGGRAGPPGGRGPPPPPFERGPPGPRDFGPRGNDGNAEYFVPLGRGPGDDFRPNDRPRGPPPQNSPGLRGHSSEPSLHHRSPPMGNNVPGRDEFGRDEFGRNRPPPGLRGPGPPAGPPGGGGRGRGRGSHVNKPAWMAQQERLTPPPRNDMPRNDMPRNDMPRSPPRDNFFPRGHNSMPSMPGQGRSAFEERRAPSPGGPPQSFERNDFQRPPPGEFQRPPPGEFQRPPPQSFDRPPLSRPEEFRRPPPGDFRGGPSGGGPPQSFERPPPPPQSNEFQRPPPGDFQRPPPMQQQNDFQRPAPAAPAQNQQPPNDPEVAGYLNDLDQAAGSLPQDPAPVKSEPNPAPVKSEPEPAPVKSEEEPPQPDDEEYTASLRLLTTDIEKRPIDLPSDVEHITDVEWAEDDPSKDSGGTHSAKSMVTALEKAPRPKANRPEPCFCEPDLDTEAVCCTDTNCALFACQEECPSNCPAGPLCGNKRIQKKQWKPLSVFDAGLKGRGLMVQEHCNPGDFIIEYVGVAVKKRYLDNLFTRYKHERMLYIMALDNDVYIDARHRGGIARYINHSCEPNCIVHRWKVRGILRAGVFALKEIREGEELSFDYQWERKRGRALTKCHCGAPTCRGTLEMEKDPDAMEHEDEMEEMDGDWLDPPPNPGREIMNRVVKVFFPKEDVHYVADVAQYDEKAKRHLLMYRGDPEEHWTDLTQEEWMILDNAGESYAITRKHLGIKAPDGATLSSGISTPRSDHSRSSSPLPPGKAKNCIYIQTPIKEAMATKHTLFKCGRYHRVHIDTDKIAVPEGEYATEKDEDLKKAFAESKDGVVWKLHITGLDVQKAVEWLEKIHASIREELDGGTALEAVPDGKVATELIIPRIIIDAVNKRFYSLKGYCYNTEVSYTHSDSKSKQFAMMRLEADEKIYVERSREYLNTELTKMCLAAGAPMTSIGVYKDYGFLGGTLTSADYQLLFQRERSPNKGATADCSEDFSGNNFAQAFMETNRCTIWVQAEEDMGRVKDNVVINESYSNKPRKIFFGVTPSRVAKLWDDLVNRVNDLRRGVQFFHLGANKIYLPTMLEPIKRNGRAGCNYFFEFIKMTCGAIVTVDRITGSSHLRIDGGDASIPGKEEKVNERIDTAMELIQLQIELLRDHHIRKQRWGFGRDWALLLDNHLKSTGPVDPKTAEASSSSQDLASLASSKPANTSADSLRLSDPRAIGTACLEISEIVTVSGLSEKVAAHAVIIFYRYLNLVQQPSDGDNSNGVSVNPSNFKIRDVQLASLFIANKSQKVVKWKRLEEVLEHSYKVFYPGSYFNKESEEAKNWERRVIKAEQTLLAALNYDVFWPGVDWVVNAVVGKKAMGGPLAENTMALALSGHVLAAGPVLWLKYGPKYAFAAIAGFLSIDIEPLFPALSLHPLTVSHAAELIYHSCQALSKMKKTIVVHSKHELFSDAKVSMMGTTIQAVQRDCGAYMSKHQGQTIDDSKFVSSPAYREISERAKLRRVFPDVRAECIEEKVLPILGKICFESKCTVRFSDGMAEGTNDIVLEGSWKALSIAEQLICTVASLPLPVPPDQIVAMTSNASSYSALGGASAQRDRPPPGEGNVIKQVKVQPGLLEMKEIDGKLGWYGTSDSSQTYDAGWKTCMAANAPQEHLDSAGLRWWVPHQYGPSLSGSLCEIFTCPKLIDQGKVDMRALALLAQSFAGGYSRLQTQYPALAAHLPDMEDEAREDERTVAISLQRWPPEKVEIKERSTSGQSMQMGYSVAALQEMQLLHQLHFLIPSPQGHPNFILPLAIALDADHNVHDKESSATSITPNKAASDILAMIERNQRSAGKRQVASGSHLVLEPTPLNIQKVMSRYQKKNNEGKAIPPAVLASWAHDILSAISFCHSNHIVLRSLLPDQIHLDHSGNAKLSGLSKVMVLHGKDRTKFFNPRKYVREKKGKDHNTEDVEPFAAPELLLGGTRHTKETDMWAFGALLANLLLGRQLFPGKDRVSKMTQVFKIVGVPSADNYEEAKKFPFHSNNMYVIGEEGKKKKYGRGVQKAIRAMLKNSFGDSAEQEFSGLIGLIDGMLHLDPKRRMTADDALRHQYMVNHSMQIERPEFRQNYVTNWLDLKEIVLTKGKSSKSTLFDAFAHHPAEQSETPVNGAAEKEMKRKAFLIGASAGADGDDLYNLDDILGSPDMKKPKL